MTVANPLNLTTLISTLQNVVQAIGSLNQTASTVFPQTSGTSTSATAGTAGAVPNQVAGYLTVIVNNTPIKIPYYNV